VFLPFSRFLSMHFVRFFTYIALCFSVASAFSVTVGTPTQCDPLNISWTGERTSSTFYMLLLNFIAVFRWASTI
jgi:hypothetical protein